MRHLCISVFTILVTTAAAALFAAEDAKPDSLRLSWEKNILTISGNNLPGKDLKVWYLEAYCRPGSTDRDWGQTTIGHATELVSQSEDGKRLKLKCTLEDGVVVHHEITATHDSVDFQIEAHNPTKKASEAHWSQPCIRVEKFTGRTQHTYLPKCFIFVDDKLTRMPFEPWAKNARYTPGQVWAPRGVDRNDVNPRPLSDVVPSNGLIGCFSKDEDMLMAVAFEPYQELFQGVIVCIHSDFRIGGLKPGESKKIHGRIYLMKNDSEALLKRYLKDFPEHREQPTPRSEPSRSER